MTKQCNKCKKILDIELFGKRKISKDGHRNYCKECHKKQQANIYNTNTEKYKATSAKYYIDNKEKISNRNKEWYKNNKEHRLAVGKKWRENNVDRIRSTSKVWRDKNKDRIKEIATKYRKTEKWKVIDANKSHRRRIQKKSTCDGSVTTESLLQLRLIQENKCYHCQNVLDMDTPYMVHLDHIVPLTKNGSHTLSNVVWSCRRCNLVKGNR